MTKVSPQPILVCGMNRSGTKWLSNLLANHPQIAAVQCDRTGGIMETNLLHVVPRKFALDREEDFAAFLTLWNMSDFVKHVGIDVRKFGDLPVARRTEPHLFKTLMDDYAARERKPYWLQKTCPQGALRFLREVPESRPIVIRRSLVDTVHSVCELAASDGRPEPLWSTVFGYVWEERVLTQVARRHRALEVQYDELKRNTADTVARVCQFLGLEYHESMLRVPYRVNSSFTPDGPRIRFGWRQRTATRLIAMILRLVPWPVLNGYATLSPYNRRTIPFVPGSFDALRRSVVAKCADARERQAEPAA